MNKMNWKKETKQKLDEITSKIEGLKTKDINDATAQDQIETLIEKLDTIRNDISRKYKNAHEEGDKKWDKIEQEIYRDFETFDATFRQAGALFRSTGKERTKDTGHFYRPGDETK